MKCLEILKFFIRIPDSFMVNMPSYSPLITLLLKIILAVLKSPVRLSVHKAILRKALNVFNTIVAFVEIEFLDRDYKLVKEILEFMHIKDFNWGVKFISSFFNDFSQRVLFKDLKEFNTEIKVDNITQIESILVNSLDS